MPSTPKPAGGYPASDHCQWNWWQLKVAPSFKLWPKVPFSHPPNRNHGCLSWGCPVWMLIFAPNLTSEASCLVPHSRGQTSWGIYPGQVRNLWQSGMAQHAKQWHPRKATLQFIAKSNLGASKDCRPTKWTYSLSAKAVKRKHGDARWWSIWEMSQFPSRHLSTSSCVASDLAQGGPDMTDDDFGRPLNSSHLMPSNSGPSISQANRLVSLPKDEQMTCIHPQFGWFYPSLVGSKKYNMPKNHITCQTVELRSSQADCFCDAMRPSTAERRGARVKKNADDLGMVKIALGIAYISVTWDDWLRWFSYVFGMGENHPATRKVFKQALFFPEASNSMTRWARRARPGDGAQVRRAPWAATFSSMDWPFWGFTSWFWGIQSFPTGVEIPLAKTGLKNPFVAAHRVCGTLGICFPCPGRNNIWPIPQLFKAFMESMNNLPQFTRIFFLYSELYRMIFNHHLISYDVLCILYLHTHIIHLSIYTDTNDTNVTKSICIILNI